MENNKKTLMETDKTIELTKNTNVYDLISLLPEEERRAIMVEAVKSQMEIDKSKVRSSNVLEEIEGLLKISEFSLSSKVSLESEHRSGTGTVKVKIKKGGFF